MEALLIVAMAFGSYGYDIFYYDLFCPSRAQPQVTREHLMDGPYWLSIGTQNIKLIDTDYTLNFFC